MAQLQRSVASTLVAIASLSLGPVAAQEADTPRVCMVAAEGDGGKHWPRWRGPTGQGIAADGAYPDSWSPTENVLWKVKVPGQGNSSPIIWDDKLFLTTAHDQGKRRSILCLDRHTGKQLWETFAPETKPEGTQGKNGWASGTPSTDGTRVYAYFGNHGLYCVDFTGKEVWHHPFEPLDAFHGIAGSPLLYKDRIIVYQEHAKKGFVAAFDKMSGKLLWRTPAKEQVGWGSPVAISVNGQDQIIVSSQNSVYAYDPEKGGVLWTCAGNLYEVIPTPTVGHDLLFCSSGRAGPTLAIRPTGAKGEIGKSHVVWRTVKGSPFVPSPLVYGDHLFMVNDSISVVSCLDAKSGKQLWQERCGEPRSEGFSGSPIGVNGKVFFTNDQGETFVLDNSPEFKLLHVNRLGEKTLATPALVAGRWHIRTQQHLWCIGK